MTPSRHSSGSIGRAIATGLSSLGATLILPVRNIKRGEELRDHVIKSTGNGAVHLYDLDDISSADSVRALASAVKRDFPTVDVLINNAAYVADKLEINARGVEAQFATNVLGYYLMMDGFHSLLKGSTYPARIVNVASNYAGGLQLWDINFTDPRYTYSPNLSYQRTKQADRMLSAAGAEVYDKDGIAVNACHPGVVTSTLLNDLGMDTGFDSPAKGAATPIFLASDPSLQGVSGKYFVDMKETKDKFSMDKEQNKAVWEACEKLGRGSKL